MLWVIHIVVAASLTAQMSPGFAETDCSRQAGVTAGALVAKQEITNEGGYKSLNTIGGVASGMCVPIFGCGAWGIYRYLSEYAKDAPVPVDCSSSSEFSDGFINGYKQERGDSAFIHSGIGGAVGSVVGIAIWSTALAAGFVGLNIYAITHAGP